MTERTKTDWLSVDIDHCEDLSGLIKRLTEIRGEMCEKDGVFDYLSIDHDEISVCFKRAETAEETTKREADDKRMRDARAQYDANKRAASMAELRRQAALQGFKLVRKDDDE